MKPDWKDAPDFAKYLAMDSFGDWYWYETKPKSSVNDGEWVSYIGELAWAGGSTYWQDSLEQRPE